MPISPKNGARGLERLIRFKHYIVLKRENRLNFGLDTATITDYSRKQLK